MVTFDPDFKVTVLLKASIYLKKRCVLGTKFL